MRPFIVMVRGVPAPKGSATAMMIGGRAVLVPGTSAAGRRAVKAWHKAVQEAAEACPFRDLDEPVAIRIEFFLSATADRYRTRHATKPDVDKLVRSTLDALTEGGILHDDARVFDLHATKFYTRDGSTGAVLSIEGCGNAEALDREELKAQARAARRSS